MNSAPVFDRVYAGLKQRLLSGAFVPGEHLDANALADSLGASLTPLRDALHRLAGERIVEARSDGFALPPMSEPDLRDLYAWNAALLMLALRHAEAPGTAKPAEADQLPSDLPSATAALFLGIGARSANREHRHAVALVNDRLHAARTRELDLLDDVADELELLRDAAEQRDRGTLRKLVVAYHRRRAKIAPAVVRALYRPQP